MLLIFKTRQRKNNRGRSARKHKRWILQRIILFLLFNTIYFEHFRIVGEHNECQLKISDLYPPAIFVNEIDNSQLPATPAGIGPVIIGRAEKGPALRPTTVNSFEEFVNIFGTPNAGNGGGRYLAPGQLNNSHDLRCICSAGLSSKQFSFNFRSPAWCRIRCNVARQ